MSETLILILLGIGGVLLHQIKRLMKDEVKYPNSMLTDEVEAREKKAKRDKILSIVLNIVGVVMIVFLRDDISAFYPITKLSIVVAGFFADSLIIGLLESRKPKF